MGGRGYGGAGRGRLYYRYAVTTRMTCIKMGSEESHFKVSLIVRDKVTRQCPQTTTFEEKREPKRYRTEVLPLTSLPTALPLGHTGSHAHKRFKRTLFIPKYRAQMEKWLNALRGTLWQTLHWPHSPPPHLPPAPPPPPPALEFSQSWSPWWNVWRNWVKDKRSMTCQGCRAIELLMTHRSSQPPLPPPPHSPSRPLSQSLHRSSQHPLPMTPPPTHLSLSLLYRGFYSASNALNNLTQWTQRSWPNCRITFSQA